MILTGRCLKRGRVQQQRRQQMQQHWQPAGVSQVGARVDVRQRYGHCVIGLP